MPRPKSAEPAKTNIKIRKSSRNLLNSLKRFLKARTQSDAIDDAHYKLTGSKVPLVGKEDAQ